MKRRTVEQIRVNIEALFAEMRKPPTRESMAIVPIGWVKLGSAEDEHAGERDDTGSQGADE